MITHQPPQQITAKIRVDIHTQRHSCKFFSVHLFLSTSGYWMNIIIIIWWCCCCCWRFLFENWIVQHNSFFSPQNNCKQPKKKEFSSRSIVCVCADIGLWHQSDFFFLISFHCSLINELLRHTHIQWWM